MTWAEVAVDSPAARRSQTFTYEVPPGLAVGPGHLVRAPFGPREVSGVVLEISDQPPAMATRPLAAVLDPKPVLLPHQIALARWLAGYYFVPLYEAIRLMLPSGLYQEVVTLFRLAPLALLPGDLPDREQAVVEALQAQGPAARETLRSRLQARVSGRQVDGALDRLVRRGLVTREVGVVGPRVQAKAGKVVRLVAGRGELEAALSAPGRRSPRLDAAIRWLLEQLPLEEERAELAWPGSTFRTVAGDGSLVEALVRRGLVAVETREVRRDPLAGQVIPPESWPDLTPGQEAVWRELEAGLAQATPSVYLLHGVTSSGKTEVYLRLLREVLGRGRQAIVLVPEIALTPQAIQRFAGRFPGRVGVLHSGLSSGEHYDEWRRIRDGEADVVVGSRSALFAPVPRLGAIVVDEEHEWSYKQDNAPRYHARDVAVKLGELAGAPVVLGSATPDVVSYARAREGRYRLLQLPERVAVLGPGHPAPVLRLNADMPAVEVVDLRAELKAGNRSIFSRALREGIAQALDRREQVILFLNRRGAATFVMCRDCGLVLRCRRCDASLVYHSAEDDLVCHLCNHREPAPDRCPGCLGSRIRYFGIGTQRVEEEVRRAFPSARILRWDRDVVRTRRAHEESLRRFQAHEADVLVGTQMIAKGLDLPLVTLVGVVTADTALHLPDLRAVERTFQLLTQVAGRAGRGAQLGRAIIQTYTPEHYCIQAASRHDYEAFAAEELRFRREQGYPPFSQLVRLLYSQPGQARVEREAGELARLLRDQVARLGLPGVDVLGPAPAYRRRLRGRYRWQVIVRGQPSWVAELLGSVDVPRGWAVDVDPVSLL